MPKSFMYYVIAPIEGLHLTCDFRIYSAELYGCPPNYMPSPDAYPTYRQPYDYLGALYFEQYTAQRFYMDALTLESIAQVPGQRLKDFTCIAFEVELDRPDYASLSTLELDSALLQYLLDRGERIVDVLRLCLFKPGEDKSIGRVGAIGNGVHGLWLGRNDETPKFITRRVSRYQLVQEPIDLTPTDLGPIYYDFAFRGLAAAGCTSRQMDNPILKRIFEGLRAFRESREMQSWEARFRHLGALVESLAKRDESERLRGKDLRDRIAQITVEGWFLYTSYGPSALTPQGLSREEYRQVDRRHREMGWNSKDEAGDAVKDLWDNVRNPLAHSVSTFASLRRDPLQDMVNMERVVITMLNGIYTAYEVEDLHEASVYDILLDEK